MPPAHQQHTWCEPCPNLAIFFWIMLQKDQKQLDRPLKLLACYFLLNYAQAKGRFTTDIRRRVLFDLLFSFELCALTAILLTRLLRYLWACYFLLNYAQWKLLTLQTGLCQGYTCYFLLNYARRNTPAKATGWPRRRLAIFFWIMRKARLSRAVEEDIWPVLLFSFELCHRAWYAHPHPKANLQILLFSFELCSQCSSRCNTWTEIAATCYFLLNYARW